ncbi:MAG: protease modulator HflC [Deltaproteobacteria bacterium]|nr:protease modulator HflC [Deltaproteobacteria bacterium]
MKSNKIIIGTLVVAALLLAVASQSLFVVDMTEQVIITQMGEYVRSSDEPGLDMKLPFVQKSVRFEKRILVSDAPPAEYLTLDKKRLVVDSYTRWRIEDAIKFYMSVKNESGALGRLDGIVSSELRTHIAAHDFHDIIGEEREPIMEDVAQKAGKIVSQYGIRIIDVRIKRADLPREVQSSVYARMNAERQRIAKKYRAEGEEKARIIRANADKEATIIMADAKKTSKETIGQGDALATKIYAEAYEKDPEFYGFTKSLEAYENILDDETTLVLDTRSRLFRYLDDPSAPR